LLDVESALLRNAGLEAQLCAKADASAFDAMVQGYEARLSDEAQRQATSTALHNKKLASAEKKIKRLEQDLAAQAAAQSDALLDERRRAATHYRKLLADRQSPNAAPSSRAAAVSTTPSRAAAFPKPALRATQSLRATFKGDSERK